MKRPALFLCAFGMIASPALARDALGMFGQWGAFRDAAVPRCYAIAMAQPSKGAVNGSRRETQPYADVGIWPRKGLRGVVHIRLSHRIARGSAIQLSLGGQKLALVGGGVDAWSANAAMDAAIVAAMRSAESMTVSARDGSGKLFSDTYAMGGVATALDAAALGCAGH